MPSYPNPKYSTSFKNGQYVIRVFLSGRFFKFWTLSEEEKLHFFLREAARSPLKAMACIHKYARKKDPLSLQLAALYSCYQNFLFDHNPTPFLALTHPHMRDYLADIFSGQPPKQTKTKLLIEMLLPGFAATLQAPRLKFIHKEQRVHVPEMHASYNAFPDLIRYQDAYYLSFREAGKHLGKRDLGKVRILKGSYKKKWKWENEALLESSAYDLRDPKFFIDGSGNLNLVLGGSIITKKGTQAMTPHVAHLKDGQWLLEQAELYPKSEKQWIWQVAWHEKSGYGFSYGPESYKKLELMKTTDGRSFEKIAEITSNLNLTESTIRFTKDGTATALIRADPKTLLARSAPPYKAWDITTLSFHGGGQNFIAVNGGYLATTRHLYLTLSNRVHERMLIGYIDKNQFISIQTLTSQIDTGYAGIVHEEDGSFTVAYYSADPDERSHLYITKFDWQFPACRSAGLKI